MKITFFYFITPQYLPLIFHRLLAKKFHTAIFFFFFFFLIHFDKVTQQSDCRESSPRQVVRAHKRGAP